MSESHWSKPEDTVDPSPERAALAATIAEEEARQRRLETEQKRSRTLNRWQAARRLSP
jgi:hypothetical protein